MHPSPDVLALLALGEEAGTPEERAHIEAAPSARPRSPISPGP